MANAEFTTGNNLFTSNFYQEYRKKSTGNFIFSPFSGEIALALTHSGAKDGTADEIQKTVHLPKTAPEIQAAVDACFKSFKLGFGHIKLYAAYKLYIPQQLVVREHYQHVATEVFRAEVERISFAKPEEAAAAINKWVEKHTESNIRDLIDPSVINLNTRAVLVNVLYLQAAWAKPFCPDETKNADFHVTSKDNVQVPFMSNQCCCSYCENKTLKATFVKLALKGGDLSLVVVLPDAVDGLAALEAQKVFSRQEYEQLQVRLSLPRFNVETDIELVEILTNLGIKKVFTAEADLSGICGGKGELFVTTVVQRAVISVDERGVEAVDSHVVASPRQRQPEVQKEFTADRPFIFFIEVNDVVLFAGRVIDPSK